MEPLSDLEARERKLLDLYEECIWSNPGRVPAIEWALAGVQRDIDRTGEIRELYFDLLSALDRCLVDISSGRSTAAREVCERLRDTRHWLVAGAGAEAFRNLIRAAVLAADEKQWRREVEAYRRVLGTLLDQRRSPVERSRDLVVWAREVPGGLILRMTARLAG